MASYPGMLITVVLSPSNQLMLLLDSCKFGLGQSYRSSQTNPRPGHFFDINMHGVAWHRPPMNVTKIKCDGSLCNVTGSGGVGVVARNHRGVVLAIRGLHVRSCNDVLDIEGMALKEAFMLAADLRLKNVIFETDCQNLVASINYKTDDMVWHKDWFIFCSRLLQKERGWNLVLIRREREWCR
ncbi:hypothetical protein QQ045_008345 [Rhodiola kirilowii]